MRWALKSLYFCSANDFWNAARSRSRTSFGVPFGATIAPGAYIECRRDGEWVRAQVLDFAKGSYKVVYLGDDPKQGWVYARDVRSVPMGQWQNGARVQVEWEVEGQGEGAVLTLDWCEVGGPVLKAQPTSGFGSRLLRQTITHELEGELDLRYEPEGVCCAVTVPIGTAGQQAA